MKTPREILFERHRQAEAELDAVRRKALAKLPAAGTVDKVDFDTAPALGEARTGGRFKKSWSLRSALWFHRALSRLETDAPIVLRKAWLELIWPSRRAWAGMAALWLALLAANLDMKSPPTAVRSATSRGLEQAFEQQRRLLAELLPPVKPPPAAPARPNARPRSERSSLFKAC